MNDLRLYDTIVKADLEKKNLNIALWGWKGGGGLNGSQEKINIQLKKKKKNWFTETYFYEG